MKGERLAEVRKNNRMTQKELALQLDVGESTVQSWEQDRSRPRVETLIRICLLFKVSADYILGLSDDHPQLRPVRKELHTDSSFIMKELIEFMHWKKQRESQE